VRVTVLASGSGGNVCVVESGGTRVLVDAGLSGREIERRLGARSLEPETIRAIFVTHEHQDHSSGALAFSARFDCPIFATAGTAAAIGLDEDLFSPFVRIDANREGRVGSLGFRTFGTPHDANESVAFAFEADDARIVIATDLGRAESRFVDFVRGATTLLLEFNHDEDMLRDGPYTWPLKKRISGGWGHLSNRQSAEVVERAAGRSLKRVVATHLSRTNNTPALALTALSEALERSGWEIPIEAADPIAGTAALEA
jgi:phosphoribosyl 1,2-cyclic phosphodiesterase